MMASLATSSSSAWSITGDCAIMESKKNEALGWDSASACDERATHQDLRNRRRNRTPATRPELRRRKKLDSQRVIRDKARPLAAAPLVAVSIRARACARHLRDRPVPAFRRRWNSSKGILTIQSKDQMDSANNKLAQAKAGLLAQAFSL